MDGKTSLRSFTEYTFPQYETAPHHTMIDDALEAVEAGQCDRLMIFMPPRHGKSEKASKRFPAWALGKKPDRQIIGASYNSDLATDFGRSVRNIVNERKFQNVFEDVTLATDSKAANRWNTNHGGCYVAAGVGTAVTGRGADIFLIDDPLKDREEADSEVQREKVWNWFTSTAYTRLMPGGAVILIQTRWHEDDLAGRLLEAEAKGGDTYEKIILPALGPNGEALWPERYSVPALQRIERTIGPRDWSALYQQRPSPDEGTFFKREWFKRHSVVPTNVSRYLCSDYAVTEGGGDFTEHGLFAIAPDNMIFIEDWWAGQTSADKWIESKLDMIEAHAPFCAFGEAGVIQKSVEPMLTRRMQERKVYSRMEWISSIHDKATRARAFQARAAMGLVSLPEGAMGERILNQLLSFPAGKHDDAVDVCGMMGRVIDQAHPAFVQEVDKSAPQDRWSRAFNKDREAGSSWKTK